MLRINFFKFKINIRFLKILFYHWGCFKELIIQRELDEILFLSFLCANTKLCRPWPQVHTLHKAFLIWVKKCPLINSVLAEAQEKGKLGASTNTHWRQPEFGPFVLNLSHPSCAIIDDLYQAGIRSRPLSNSPTTERLSAEPRSTTPRVFGGNAGKLSSSVAFLWWEYLDMDN